MPSIQPTKQAVREYMAKRFKSDDPPPSPEEIWRQLGGELAEAEREARDRPR